MHTPQYLLACWPALNKAAASGVDKITADDYSPYSADIQPRPMSAAFVPIILFEACLILPVFIDLATGTWYDFPEEIHADFKAPLMAPMVDIKWGKIRKLETLTGASQILVTRCNAQLSTAAPVCDKKSPPTGQIS